MKAMFLSVVMITGLFSAAVASADATSDCLGAVQTALQVTADRPLSVTGGTTNDGLKCQFETRFEKANSGLTHQDYRSLKMVFSSEVRYADGGVSPDYPIEMAYLEDNTQGLKKTEIQRCTVTADGIDLDFEETQISGWRTSRKHHLNIGLQQGKVVSVDFCSFK